MFFKVLIDEGVILSRLLPKEDDSMLVKVKISQIKNLKYNVPLRRLIL